MSKWWNGLCAVAVGAVVAGCGSATSDGDAPERPAPPRVYAYTTIHFGQSILETTSDLVLMDGTEELGRTPLGGLNTDPAFTTDGRYAFSLAGDEVLAIAVATGTVTRMPCAGCFDRQLECQCQTVVPFGDSTVAWFDSANRLVVGDLAADEPAPETTTTAVPTWTNDWNERLAPQLLAGAADAALVGYPHPLSAPGPLYLAGPTGAPRPLTTNRPTPVDEAEFSPDGGQLAVWGTPESNECATVTLIDRATGVATTTQVTTNSSCATRDGFVTDLWWDLDGTPNLYFQPDDQQTSLTGATQRTLAGDAWTLADVDTATQEHQVTADTTAVLSHPGVRDENRLYVRVAGKRTMVEPEANNVVTAPR